MGINRMTSFESADGLRCAQDEIKALEYVNF